MAYLLLLHQKMSLKRKVNKLTLAQTSIGTRKERITKRIENVQKSYARKQSKLEAQAKQMTSMTNSIMNNRMMAMSQAYQMVDANYFLMTKGNGNNCYDEDYKKYYDAMVEAQKQGTDSQAFKDAQKRFNDYINTPDFKTQMQLAQSAAMQYNNQLAVQKQWQQQMMSTFTTNVNDQVSIWLEAQTQALEDEEQMALAPLNEEDTQIDIEQASNEAQLSYAQSRLESIESALQSQTQEAPKFGA